MDTGPLPNDSVLDSLNDTPRPTEVEIAAFAHRLWEDRGCPAGSPDEDWFEAEKELMSERA